MQLITVTVYGLIFGLKHMRIEKLFLSLSSNVSSFVIMHCRMNSTTEKWMKNLGKKSVRKQTNVFLFFLIDLLVSASVIGVCILCNQHSCSGRSLMSAQMQSSLRDSGVVSFSSFFLFKT